MVTKTAKKFKWKLLAGYHEENVDGEPHEFNAYDATNNIIETDLDLGKMFNSPNSEKFALVQGISDDEIRQRGFVPGAAGVPHDNYDQMTIEELKKFAEEEEINIDGLKKKSGILRKIRSELAISPANN